MSYNVLIVDDSASMRAIVAKALRLSGVPIGDIQMASDGYEALSVLSNQWVDIVLADLNMPRMGGIELVERMQHQGITSQVPVVVVSTESRQEVIQALLAMGATAFLRKPFAPEQLGELISRVLSSDFEPPAEDVLNTAFFEAVEGFAMLVGDVAEQPVEVPAEALLARVAFVGPGMAGEVLVGACPTVCSAIARSATGEDEGDGADALAELANMTAGQVIERIAGGPFALHPPEREVGDGQGVWTRVGRSAISREFEMEGLALIAGMDVRKRW